MSHVDLTGPDAVVLIALGANVPGPAGAPAETLAAAIAKLPNIGIAALKVSSFLKTPAYPPSDQPDFLNAVAIGESARAPLDILSGLHAIERELGRVRSIPWGPRPIDLDLLAVGDIVSPDWQAAAARGDRPGEAPGPLVLPHPRMHLRRFVLEPLVEIAPEWRHPALGLTARELLAKLPASGDHGSTSSP
jgi:2-amino-4-hydroxy-6-hydroxymethyldihydropteridine diphosphokinase